MLVYLVRQTQITSGYDEKTIYVCSTKERADEYCRKLNKEYGYGVKFNDEWDFVEFDDEYDYDQQHYYDWECMEIDEELALLQ